MITVQEATDFYSPIAIGVVAIGIIILGLLSVEVRRFNGYEYGRRDQAKIERLVNAVRIAIVVFGVIPLSFIAAYSLTIGLLD